MNLFYVSVYMEMCIMSCVCGEGERMCSWVRIRMYMSQIVYGDQNCVSVFIFTLFEVRSFLLFNSCFHKITSWPAQRGFPVLVFHPTLGVLTLQTFLTKTGFSCGFWRFKIQVLLLAYEIVYLLSHLPSLKLSIAGFENKTHNL